MLEGLDRGTNAIFLIGYHGRAGARFSALNHTYFPYETRLNGEPVDETALNAFVAGTAFDVPVALVTGDEWTVQEAQRTLGNGLIGVATKRSLTRYAAASFHPNEACRRITIGAHEAMSRAGTLLPYTAPPPYHIEIDFRSSSQADRASLMPGIERVADRTIAYASDDIVMFYRAYQALMVLGASGEAE
jgi:D-amino peptidase